MCDSGEGERGRPFSLQRRLGQRPEREHVSRGSARRPEARPSAAGPAAAGDSLRVGLRAGRAGARPAGRSQEAPTRPPRPPPAAPLPRAGARARAAACTLGGRGAETHEVGPGQPFSLALESAPGRAGPVPPRPPTVGAPSLLELLDLLQAQPRALVDAEVSQHLLHGLCVRVLHCCGGPAGLASRPRGLLASASHSVRGLVPPRAPKRGLASRPPPPAAASASRGAESPRTPPAGDRPSGCPASPAPASGSAGRRGPRGPPSPQKRGPPSPSTARPERRPRPPSPLPALLR